MTRKMVCSLSSHFFPILISFFLLVGEYAAGQVEPAQMKVYVEPAKITVVVYSTFRVNISVADVDYDGLFGYEFKLNYNNSILKGVDVVFPENHFLTPNDPQNLFIIEREINQSGGHAEVAATLLGSEPAKFGNGTLLNVMFRAEEVGTSNLTFSNYIFEDPNAQEDHVTVSDGIVEVVLPDFNDDGKVDISDLTFVCQAFGSRPGDARWNPVCDVNKDFTINILDVAVTAKAYGKAVER